MVKCAWVPSQVPKIKIKQSAAAVTIIDTRCLHMHFNVLAHITLTEELVTDGKTYSKGMWSERGIDNPNDCN